MTPSNPKTNYLSTSEVARLLGVSVGTVQHMVETGELKAWKTAGGHRRIHKESVVELQNSQNDSAQPVKSGKSLPETKPANRKFSVLVVEDDPVTVKLYEYLFAKTPHSVQATYADDGIEALLKLGQQHFDLLILDIDIPYVDGYEMLRRISVNEFQKTLNVLIVTGTAFEPSDIKSNDITILEKPINKAFFQGYIQGAIDTYRSKQNKN